METQRTTSVPIVLPPTGNINPAVASRRSQTRWGWFPYKDVSNMGPLEIRSQLGYRDQRWTEFKRCVPYPFGNLTSYDPDRSAAEAISSLVINSETLPKIEYLKYALDQIEELEQIYGEEGFSDLKPLMGMDDTERVGQIIQVVQPFAYSIHEMAYEFSVGVDQRIADSNLSDEDQAKARALVPILQSGAQKAETRALAQYEALISSMSDKSVGQPGIANPNKFHEWVCVQLNKPVPKRVNRMEGQEGGGSNEAINILAKRALKEESAAEAMALELQAEREARARDKEEFDRRIAALEAKTKAK